MEKKYLLSAKEAAEQLGVSPSWMLRRFRNGEIMAARLGRLWRTSHAALDAYLESRGMRVSQPPAESTR